MKTAHAEDKGFTPHTPEITCYFKQRSQDLRGLQTLPSKTIKSCPFKPNSHFQSQGLVSIDPTQGGEESAIVLPKNEGTPDILTGLCQLEILDDLLICRPEYLNPLVKSALPFSLHMTK